MRVYDQRTHLSVPQGVQRFPHAVGRHSRPHAFSHRRHHGLLRLMLVVALGIADHRGHDRRRGVQRIHLLGPDDAMLQVHRDVTLEYRRVGARSGQKDFIVGMPDECRGQHPNYVQEVAPGFLLEALVESPLSPPGRAMPVTVEPATAGGRGLDIRDLRDRGRSHRENPRVGPVQHHGEDPERSGARARLKSKCSRHGGEGVLAALKRA